MTPWSHLPNAQHIDNVLAHVKLHPERWRATYDAAWDAARGAAWDAAWDAARDAAWDAARGAARDAARGAARDAAWDAAYDAAWGAAWDAAWDAVLALVAYDECAHFLTQPVESVHVAARLGVPAAVLLLAACIAMKEMP